jgi:hypothetical protein
MKAMGDPPSQGLLPHATPEQLNLAGYHRKALMAECLAREQVMPDFHYRRVA